MKKPKATSWSRAPNARRSPDVLDLATLPYRTYLPHQHSRAPEVQTTGDTTPVQQIVYAESLTTSGGSNA